jgi:hypothetical protein
LAVDDSFSDDSMHDVMEWRLDLLAPDWAAGFRVHYVFFSEEYDEWIGTAYNDKFYMILESGQTNDGAPTVINFTECRDPDDYWDFECQSWNTFCEEGDKLCFIAINAGESECCWYDGCPDGTAETDIGGTGFECAESQAADNAEHGSSTGWQITEWPVEGGEEFAITFHLHDTADGIQDSEVILDSFEFVESLGE